VELAAGFEFDVLVHDPYVDAETIAAAGAEKVDFETLLDESRYVSIHTPLTPETRGMFDDDAFGRMRSDALVINTARGPIIDADALGRALAADEIAGAALDVTPEEPPDPTPPIDDDRVIYTPHVAWYSESSMTTLRRTVTEDVLRVLRGESPINPVNDPSG
jgi:D-3-phosphoglycerate dehydrogenase